MIDRSVSLVVCSVHQGRYIYIYIYIYICMYVCNSENTVVLGNFVAII